MSTEPPTVTRGRPFTWSRYFGWIGLLTVLFQVFLWWGFLIQSHRPHSPGLETFDVVSYTSSTVWNIALLILIAVRREPIWLAVLWLAITFSQLTVNFSFLYRSKGTSSNFTTPLTHLDAIYFTLGTLSTAGTGSLSAVGRAARGIQTLQFVLDFGLVLFAVGASVSRFATASHARGQ